MNFEIIDNAYQVTVLLICMLLSAWLGIRQKNRGFIMLSFGYGCFMMGTLFFVLYLAILGRVPQIFYTCEISWLAAYLFFLSLLLLRKESEPLPFSAIALIPAVIVAVVVLLFKIFGPALTSMHCLCHYARRNHLSGQLPHSARPKKWQTDILARSLFSPFGFFAARRLHCLHLYD